jgi:D-3-phosphoglycerate dehydrogenase
MSPRAAEILGASPKIQVDVRAGLTAGDLESVIGDYHGLLVRSRSKVTAKIIDKAGKLEIIGRAGIGVDNIDVVAASRRGILVENAPSGNSVTTAEHALCLLLSLARHIAQATASMKNGKWEKTKFEGSEIMGKTLGIIGLGNIGRIVCDRAQGLKMKVVAFDPFMSKEAADRLGAELLTLDELLPRADFITLHTPLTEQTKNLLDRANLARCKKGVLIVNAARGGIIDDAALIEALDSGQVGGAALDVFPEEPVPAGYPVVAHAKVICTPHLGASTAEAQEKVAIEVAEQMLAYVERGEVVNAVNVAAVSAEAKDRMAPWLELARALGALVGQISRGDGAGFADQLAIEVTGEPSEVANACTTAALKGLLGHFMDVPVNDVNARVIAADRGLEISEVKKSRDRDLTSAIAVSARVGGAVRTVRGTLFHLGQRVEPRVVQIDDYVVEVTPRGTLLAVTNRDQPGVIGAVGTLLGSKGINVNSLTVGQDAARRTALALWNLATDPADELVTAIRGLALIESARVIKL